MFRSAHTTAYLLVFVSLCWASAVADEPPSKPAARAYLERLDLADGSHLSIWTRVESLKQPKTCEVWLVRHPKGKGGKQKSLWNVQLTSVDYQPKRKSYLALVKEADDRIFVFCTWNDQHFMVDTKNGKVLKQGEGDDALKEHGDLAPLKLNLGKSSTGRAMTKKEVEEFDRLHQEAERQKLTPK